MPSRLLFRLVKGPLWMLCYFSPRLYMQLYLPLLRWVGVTITGVPRYISPGCKFDDFNLVSIGDRAVISNNAMLLTHDYSLTTGLNAIGEPPATDVAFLRPITIGDNVFVGMSALILPGAKILENTIVGAGSVVRGAVGPNMIVLGNPAVPVARLSEKAQHWKTVKERNVAHLRVDRK